MANVYTWEITQLSCYPTHENYENVVFSVSWRRKVENNGHVADVCGNQKISVTVDDKFTPFEQLTEPQVQVWLVAALGSSFIQDMDANLAQQIAILVNPPVAYPPLPW